METAIGRRVAEAREHRGLTQAELAAEVGVKQQTVGAWESGKNIPPTEKLGRLSEVLSVSVDWLVLGNTDTANDLERIHRLRRALDVLEEALGEGTDRAEPERR